MYQASINANDAEWQALDFPDVAMKVLWRDEATGATTVMTRMDAGAEIPAHRHTHADETVFVLEGDFVEDGADFGAGQFFVGKAGAPHGPHATRSGCRLLTTFSAEVDFVLED